MKLNFTFHYFKINKNNHKDYKTLINLKINKIKMEIIYKKN